MVIKVQLKKITKNSKIKIYGKNSKIEDNAMKTEGDSI
jgi:hypothetical protein